MSTNDNETLELMLERTGLNRALLARMTGYSPASAYRWGRASKVPSAVIAFLRLYWEFQSEKPIIDDIEMAVQMDRKEYAEGGINRLREYRKSSLAMLARAK